jgi:hypothetical protein
LSVSNPTPINVFYHELSKKEKERYLVSVEARGKHVLCGIAR